MGTVDLSRAAANPAKRYRGALVQMGRVFSDDDFNDNERIHDETERRVLVDLIGATGTPDDGFQIASPTTNAVNNRIDFVIRAGALYLGGHRLEAHEDERFQLQSDWLQQADSNRPAPPYAGERFDLVWIEAVEQEVTAVEDSELFEAGLDTGDTSARTRIMRRVRVLPDIGSADCQGGWNELLAGLAGEGTINDELELVPDTTVTVGFDTPLDPGDLCSPSGEDGYRGAENQAIRVQLLGATAFTWGYDNASPLYRVTVRNAPNPPGGGRRLLTVQTLPRDHAHWPLAGQVVELLAWSAVLPNGEKVAERSGFLTTVATSYNPDTRELLLTDPLPAGFGVAWQDRDDEAELGPEYFFLRVWDRGDDTSAPSVGFVANSAESLPNTGLTVTFSGTQLRAEDHWIAAARPATPTRVVPWDLEEGRPPHGHRRWIAPLAVIRWAGGSDAGTVVDDCRETFLPLTRVRGCCTVTVGDGLSSHGQFDSIQDAVDHLPAAGGEVCVLAGRYRQRFEVRDRHDVTVHGCGPRTVLVPPEDSDAPAITITDSQSVTIASMAIDAASVVGVLARSDRPASLHDLELRQLAIASAARSAIDARHVNGLRVLFNEVRLQMLEQEFGGDEMGVSAAIFASGTRIVVEQNDVRLVAEMPRLRMPLGGIQVGGDSNDVELRRNRLEGGNGNGITLGSAVRTRGPGGDTTPDEVLDLVAEALPAPWIVTVDANGCIHIDPGGPDGDGDPDDADDAVIVVSEGPLDDIRIVDNHIRAMGSNGISSLPVIRRMQGSSQIDDLRIESNRIVGNLGLELPSSPALLSQGFGGVSLQRVDGLRVAENRIVDNGRDFDHPVCGVYVAQAADVILHDNDISGNGRDPMEERLGIRCGVFLGGITDSLRHEGPVPAVRIHDNVVASPAGPALIVFGRGAFSIEHNALSSTGLIDFIQNDFEQFDTLVAMVDAGSGGDSPVTDLGPALMQLLLAQVIASLGGAAVFVFNTGTATDLGKRAVNVGALASSYGSYADPPTGILGGPAILQPSYGPVLFHDNQVTLELREQGLTRSAILVFTLDDLSAQGNQSSCETDGALFTNASLVGWSTRVQANRLRERPGRATFSATTVGIFNNTAHNQSTHCLRVVGVQSIDAFNQVQLEAITGVPCEELTSEPPDEAVIGTVPRLVAFDR